jgi:small subunit ribosomal protein S18
MIRRNDKVRKPGKCPFCEQVLEPSFTDPSKLRGLLTERGKIVARSRSGVCLKHQRHLTLAIKRARYMALLPYISLAR